METLRNNCLNSSLLRLFNSICLSIHSLSICFCLSFNKAEISMFSLKYAIYQISISHKRFLHLIQEYPCKINSNMDYLYLAYYIIYNNHKVNMNIFQNILLFLFLSLILNTFGIF